MIIESTTIPGVIEIHPKVIQDSRGYFFESYRKDLLQKEGIHIEWVQENQSFSKAGTVRGLHFQKNPYAQAKLVRVLSGKVLDVAVDLRKDSDSYGEVYSKILDAQDHHMLFIPEGFAHGFSVFEDAEFCYRCSNFYNKNAEGGILWNDPKLNIDWGVSDPIISDKDMNWPTLNEFTAQSDGGL